MAMGGDQSSDGADASLATKRPVMVLPRALAILLAATALLAGSYSALGQVPVALVEEVVAPHADVEAMEYLIAGRVIHLMSNETLVLGYFQSCWRERITGGTVTVGTDQSAV